MDNPMTSSRETSFLADVNPNLGIVHRICRVYFPEDPMGREDVFQEIMYQLWKAYPHFRRGSKFSTWMYSVALNTAITHVRKAMRGRPSHETPDPAAPSPDMDDDMARREDAATLYAAIATLPEIDKAIALLHLDGQTYDEIASITGLTRNNVSVRLVRLKRAIKDYIVENQ